MSIPGRGASPRLADHTTLRVGGPVGGWLVAEEPEHLIEATLTHPSLFVLGGGSNVVAADAGIAGSVLRVATRGRDVRVQADRVEVTLAAGEPWDPFVAEAVDHGWAGIEALAGIPGLAGATPIQNVGAYGQEIAEVITRVRVRDRALGRTTELAREDCGFGYRTSRFKREPDRWLVLEVGVSLPLRATGQVRYADLARLLGVSVGDEAPLATIRDGVLHLRRSRGMVLDDADPDTWSAGSFFTNPILAEGSALPDACPRYPTAEGVKVSAAWLIEQAGLSRGFALPDRPLAALSGKHTLAITNRGGATAEDVMALARFVQMRVRDVYGVDLAIEPVLIGSPG